MIWIDLENKLPTDTDISGWTAWSKTQWDTWQATSAALVYRLENLQRQGNTTGIKALIKENSSHWGALKDWLAALSEGKCWFTDARDICSHYDVEHFRPKNEALDLDGTEHDGYWWMAFDYMNYRLCGTVPNRMKGGWFPLRTGSLRATYANPCHGSETPYLLDPIDEDDVALIAYDEEGKVIPRPGSNPWDQKRVEESAKRFKLNAHVPLAEARRKIWQQVNRLVADYDKAHALCAKGPNPSAKERMKGIRSKIRALTRPEAELSSVARWCLKVQGITLLNTLAA